MCRYIVFIAILRIGLFVQKVKLHVRRACYSIFVVDRQADILPDVRLVSCTSGTLPDSVGTLRLSDEDVRLTRGVM